jgi:hypothetical protein
MCQGVHEVRRGSRIRQMKFDRLTILVRELCLVRLRMKLETMVICQCKKKKGSNDCENANRTRTQCMTHLNAPARFSWTKNMMSNEIGREFSGCKVGCYFNV